MFNNVLAQQGFRFVTGQAFVLHDINGGPRRLECRSKDELWL